MISKTIFKEEIWFKVLFQSFSLKGLYQKLPLQTFGLGSFSMTEVEKVHNMDLGLYSLLFSMEYCIFEF